MRQIKVFHTIKFKVICVCVVFCIILLVVVGAVTKNSIRGLVESLIHDRLRADINYIEDLISQNSDDYWNIKGNAIYFGDILIGDGTEKTANYEPFLEHEAKTGTFAYVFMLDKDAVLGYVEGDEYSVGYEEGHYLRIAGSTKNPRGQSIVGTYIQKDVADALDRDGYYYGEANVAGGMIYCIYNTLLNEDGEIVGAVVVGRNISELNEQIDSAMRSLLYALLFLIAVLGGVLVYLMTRNIKAIEQITDYIDIIKKGDLPEEELHVNSEDEMQLIANSINQMVRTLHENTSLKKKSETDFLTKLPNRLAFDEYAQFTDNYLKKEPCSIAVEFMDIDYFKEYNDNYGHPEGDKCIIAVSDILKQIVEEYHSTFACRIGGDEFVLVYQNQTRDGIVQCVEEIKKRLEAYNLKHEYSKVSDRVTVTQGICYAEKLGDYTVSEMLKKADEVLYEVKKHSRNAYEIESI